MSTTFPSDPSHVATPHRHASSRETNSDSARKAEEAVDFQLVQETKHQIRSLVQEIAQLCQSEIPVEQFYDEFLRRVVSALASAGGAIWEVGPQQTIELKYQINLAQAGLAASEESQQRHAGLLRRAFRNGAPALVPPQSGPGGEVGVNLDSTPTEEAGNPTEYLLVLGAVALDEETLAVVEIFQRPGSGPTTQRGYLRFLIQMCDLAADYFKNRRLRLFHDRQQLWERLEHFLKEIHRSLDLLPTVYAIANEGRETIGADRVSLAIQHGHRCRVEAVSGLDAIDRRAELVKRLERLASLVSATGEPLWYTGDSSALPPQIDSALHAYIDHSHCKMLGILPLRAPAADSAATSTAPPPLGALIVERLTHGRPTDDVQHRAAVIAEHSAAALASALQHDRLFLMPFWRWLGQAAWVVQLRQLPKTLFALAVALGLVVASVVVTHDFDVAASGKLQPSFRRDVFAPVDGTVVEVPVKHADLVRRGQLLARLENSTLDYEITTLSGQLTTTREQISMQARALAESYRLSSFEQNRLSGKLQELRQEEANLGKQLDLLSKKQELLEIRCRFPGQVVTWQVGDKLMRRPVQRGQALMTVVDPSGDWELELYAPERYMGYITAASADAPRGLPVTFLLSSHPGRSFSGRVVEVQRTAQTQGPQGATVLVRVAIDKTQIPDLRSETTVTARINCGRKAIGFVWFHDLLETIQTKVLFWI